MTLDEIQKEVEEINLDSILENNSISFNVEIYKDDSIIYISNENDSGCTYNYETTSDILVALSNYIRNYVEDKL